MLGSILGLVSLTALNIYGRRYVNKMYLYKTGDRICLELFNPIWKPKIASYKIDEIGGRTASYGEFTKFEVTSVGNMWINLESNLFRGNEDLRNIVDRVLDGRRVDLSLSNELIKATTNTKSR